ncbi:MAG TPA: hypothetical protein VIH37_12400 [Candidatus Limnocylindrales bacterium]
MTDLLEAAAPERARGPVAALTSRWAEAAIYVWSAVVSSVVTVFALQLWRADLRVPFTYIGDAVAIADHAKTVLMTGWFTSQPLLGFPAGQHYQDFPTADNLNFAAFHVLGWFTSNWAVVVNVYFLIGFPLAALAMTWFLREVGVSRILTVVLAVLYAIAPYHFERGISHLFLASYYTIPLALVVVLRAMRGEPLWGAGRGPRVVRLFTGRGAVTALVLAVTATQSTYYAFFTLLLVAVAGLAALLRDRDWRRFGGAVAGGVLTVGVMLANMLPATLYERQHGTSATGFVRSPVEVEIYALKLSQLLLPVPGHRIGILASLRARYDSAYPLPSEEPALGVIAGVGFVIAFVVLAVTLASMGRKRVVELTDEQATRTTTIAHLSMLTFVSFLFATVGGLATFISFVTPDLRGWNRLSIFIAALCLGIIGLVTDAGLARLARRPRFGGSGARRAAALTLAGVLLVVGYLDQVTPGATPDYAGNKAQFAADDVWFGKVQTLLPAGSAVFQVPHLGFPEVAPVNGVYDSDFLKPYLHTTTLSWSAGGIKGRPTTDWPYQVAVQQPATMAHDLAVLGFSAILVDRAALSLEKAGPFEAELANTTGTALATSADGRYALYDLRGVAKQMTAANGASVLTTVRDALSDPVTPYAGHGTTIGSPAAQVFPDPQPTWTVKPGGVIKLANDRGVAVPVTLSATVSSLGAKRVAVTAGRTVADEDVTAGPAVVQMTLDVPPGGLEVSLAGDAGGPVLVDGLSVVEQGLPALAPG